MARFFKALAIAVVLAVLLSSAVAWWFVYRPLPRIEGQAQLAGLRREVTVDRDAWGVPHIRAASMEDLAEAQGYVMAQDRLWQMDLLRRVAGGELSEIFGPSALPLDQRYRTLGFRRVAEREAAALQPDAKALMEAYARGVNHLIEDSRGRLPFEFPLLGYQPRPWKPSDSLVIAGYMYETLTSTWKRELNRAKVAELVGEERARDLFVEASDLDHFVVGGSDEYKITNAPARKRYDDDTHSPKAEGLMRTSAGTSWPNVPQVFVPADSSANVFASLDATSALWDTTQRYLDKFSDEMRQGIGSNNWVVNGTHTASGKPLLANDTHLELGVPSIWYIVHLTAPELNVKGVHTSWGSDGHHRTQRPNRVGLHK